MRRITIAIVCIMVLGLVTGCGSSKSSSSSSSAQPQTSAGPAGTSSSAPKTRFAKTKFVLHAGLAFGAFHRYIYKPVKNGAFSAAGRGRKAVILIKGGLAAAFIYHELKLAARDVRSSPLLSKLFSPLTSLADRIKGLGPGLRKGSVAPAAVEQDNSQISSLQSQSAAGGAPAPDRTPPANLVPVQ